jgi:DNA damage-binding protein 1
LRIEGTFHLGDFVNRFRPGSLVMLPGEMDESRDYEIGAGSGSSPIVRGASKRPRTNEGSDMPLTAVSAVVAHAADTKQQQPTARPRFIFGTVSGAIGVVISLPPSTFQILHLVQVALAKVVIPVGGLPHSVWRSFYTDRNPVTSATSPNRTMRGFIDGDLVETFLDLDRVTQEKVVAAMPGPELETSGDSTSAEKIAVPGIEDLTKLLEDLLRMH